MKGNTLIGLALLALAAVAIALWSMQSRAPERDVGNAGPLVPDLFTRINAIDEVKIITAGNQVQATLKRSEAGWTLAERDGYPADAGKLRGLLLALVEAQRVEAKTINPALHERLGVEDLAAAEARGVAVELQGGGQPLRIIVGDNATQGKGTYVRLDGDAQSWLIDRNVAVERKPTEWLQRELANISAARIAEVEVTPDTGAPIRIARKSEGEGGDFALQDVPRSREPLSEFVADATAGLLDALRFEDVLAASAVEESTEAARNARYRTQEGLEIRLRSWKADGKSFARLTVALDEAAAEAWAAAAGTDEGAADADSTADADAAADKPEGESSEPAETPESRLADLRAELATLQQRYADRVFVLPGFKAGNLERDLEAYLKPKS